ncbi:MAG: hypothetical protein M3128_03540 [Verrucomicrobiota bacterium]|nr:hypothetical protein [Verrucomicrobiota bacterium]
MNISLRGFVRGFAASLFLIAAEPDNSSLFNVVSFTQGTNTGSVRVVG